MKKTCFRAVYTLAALLFLYSFTAPTKAGYNKQGAQPGSETCYPVTAAQLDDMGGVFAAGILPENRLQAFFGTYGIKPVSKEQMLQNAWLNTAGISTNRFQCNTGWTYFYSYGPCTANYNRPECGYYVRVRYWKKYRFNACRYEEVTISSTVVCC